MAVALFSGVSIPAAATITHVDPLAVVPGKRTIVTFAGTGLEKMTNLWSSAGFVGRRVPGTNSHEVRFAVDCPETARGIQAVQLDGPDGASNFKLIMVDAIRAETKPEHHHSRTNAWRVKTPCVLDAAARSEQIDYYMFSAAAGENFSIEAIAHRIGSEMDPVVRVYDSAGRELAFCDDEPGVWRDSRFVFTAVSGGEYVLAVHDSGFGGGAGFEYRLRVTHDPLVWYTYPLIDPTEAGAAFEQIGSLPAEPVGSPANPPMRPSLSTFPSVAEVEPNDSAEHAQRVTLPTIVNGKLDATADVDCFRFTSAKGDLWMFESATRSLGSPCDLVLTLKELDGTTLRESDPTSAGDAFLNWAFNREGEYLLQVRELSGNHVSPAPYRVKIKRLEKGVSVGAEENRLEAAPGASATLNLRLGRSDYSGPVCLTLDPAIPGVSLDPSEIPERKDYLDLKLQVAQSVAPGSCVRFKMRAAMEGGAASPVSTRQALRKQFPLMLNPPLGPDGIFTLTVKPN
jgi:hypothetical protein